MAVRALPLAPSAGAAPSTRQPSHARWLVATTCNLGCEGCRRAELAPGPMPHDGTIVVAGGEPTLAPSWLAEIRASGRPWELETNGTLLYAPRNVALLRAAGVRRVRMFLPGWDEASTDARARAPGTAELQARAARNLSAAGIDLAFVVPVAEGVALVPFLERAERLSEGRPRGEPLAIFLAWQLAPDAAPSAALELELGRLALAALERSMLARFEGPEAPSPCTFRRPEGFASLFAGMEPRPKPEACEACPITAACAGPAGAAHAVAMTAGDRAPVAWEEARTALLGGADTAAWVLAGDAHRWGRENFVSIGSEPDLAAGRPVCSALIRPIFHCNQDCTFCWVDLAQKTTPDAAVAQALALTGLFGMETLSITGGEPTLDKRLPRWIRLARALGARQVTLQTNAVRLERRALAEELVRAGLTRAFVSLHGATAETSDAITRKPGTFVRTLAGVKNLLELGVSVGIGVVFTFENQGEARRIVELVATELRGADLTLSVAAPVNDRLDATAIAPRYTDLAPALREAAGAAREHGLSYGGLYGQCGLPPCVLDADPVCFPELARAHPDWSAADDFVHADACDGCSLRPKCPGVRRSYAAAFGTSELRAVTARPP